MYMINTFDKKDFGWGSKILTPGPSILTNRPIRDHSELGESLMKLQHREGLISSWVSLGASWEGLRAICESLESSWEGLRAS